MKLVELAVQTGRISPSLVDGLSESLFYIRAVLKVFGERHKDGFILDGFSCS